ncbi:hypothetical protein NIES4103_17970 [Nostoc sp. NIES-4103]|nr:hypothetical protein NIES4103_17970 [Nostoc sp. NIES-4103]
MKTIVKDSPTSKVNRILPFLEKNYDNNLESDYTEKIEELDKNFNYKSNSNHYWSEPEQSVLYGTPLYQQASPSQKIALNHLHWVGFYKVVADSEIELTFYNTITADCLLAANKDYAFIADMLNHETYQERKHIHSFAKINYQTIKALLGTKALINSGSDNSTSFEPKSFHVTDYLLNTANFIGGIWLKDKEQNYSQKLIELQDLNKSISSSTPANPTSPTPTSGFFNGYLGNTNTSLRKFFPFSWGSYPFLAANFYVVRYMANIVVKNNEFEIHKYCRKLQKAKDFIPAPTAISHYHFLDEAFHTTTSLYLARDFYKSLPKPSKFEKLMANLAVLQTQRENLNGLSGMIPNRFVSDSNAITFIMKLLQSPVFDMSLQEAIHWLEKCLCYEHEGFHFNLKVHNHLLANMQRFAEDIDYLWPVNREMRLMADAGSIKKALNNNIKAFKNFSRTIEKN